MNKQALIDRYIDETSSNMSDASKQQLHNLLTSFFKKKDVSLKDLKREDVVDMFSSMDISSTSYFISHKSKINSFAKWLYEHEYGSEELLKIIPDIQYSDMNRIPLFNKYFFRDIEELYEVIEKVFMECGSEFDTFKAAAILVWSGIGINYLPDLLKKDLDISRGTVINPVTREEISLPSNPAAVIYFLEKYRDASSFDTRKFGGRTMPYVESDFLLRSYKNAHLTAKQANHLSISANNIASEHGIVFKWNKIYLSGVYYRIYQYELTHGEINRDINLLQVFFPSDRELTPQRKKDILRKYKEYQEFRAYAYS